MFSTSSDTRKPLPGQARPVRRNSRYKKTLAAFLAGSILLSALLVLTAFVLDPLQVYRKAEWYSPVFSTEQRYQNPGLAKNYDYDTIIIGTSMTENFLPSKVDAAIGGKSMKLSIRGSTAGEHYEIAKLALDTGKVKTVIWGLDYFSLKSGVRDDQGPFPFYLYDNNFLNDYKYWFNESTYEQLFKGLARQVRTGKAQDLETLYNWHAASAFSEFLVVKHYREARNEEAYFSLNEDPLEDIQASFDNYILSLVKAYPDVEFKFYYPPYSILRQVVWKETNPERYENQLTMKKWMHDRFSQHNNAEVYDFQTEAVWTFDLDLYKDMSHHSKDVNTWIAEAIGRRDPHYLVTADNVDVTNEMLQQQVEQAVVDSENRLHRYEVVVRAGEGDQEQAAAFSKREIASEGELMVPVKEAIDVLGASLDWDQATKTLTLKRGEDKLSMAVASDKGLLNGEEIAIPNPAKLERGTTYVPLAFVAEALGWDAAYTPMTERLHKLVLSPSE